MNRVSVLQQRYLNQKQSIVEQQDKEKNTIWQGNYRFCIVWMFIGMLLGGIPLTAILILYIKDSNNQTASTTIIPKITPALRWNLTGITIAGVTNQPGTTSNELNMPIGITLDYLNSLYISDFGNNRVQKYLINASFGLTIAGQANGTGSNSSMYLSNPADVAVDTNNNVYVADTLNNRVQFWSDGSLSGVTIAGNGSGGMSNNQLIGPYGISRDSNSGALYIADTFNNRVMRYLPGTLSGNLVAGTGALGPNNTQLPTPYGIYFDLPTNSLVIAIAPMNRIVRWIIGTSSWTLVAGGSSGLSGSSSTQFNTPTDVTLDPMGNVYVADAANHRVQFFPMGQLNATTIAGVTNVIGNSSTLLNEPFSIALDSQLNLYVSDTYNQRVQKFLRY